MESAWFKRAAGQEAGGTGRAAARVVLASVLLLYTVVVHLAGGFETRSAAELTSVVAAVYLVAALGLAGWAALASGPGRWPARMGAVGDAAALGAAIHVAGPWAGAFYAVLLWWLVEHARWQSWPGLGLLLGLSVLSLGLAWGYSPFWSALGPLVAGLSLPVVAVPVYVKWLRDHTGAGGVAVSGEEEVGRRLSTLAHDLRAPLNTILGYSQMLKEDALAEGRRQMADDLERIGAAGQRLLYMINAVVELARMETGQARLHREWFAVRELVEAVAENVAPLARAGFRPDICCDCGDLEIHTDRFKLGLILETAVQACLEAGGGGTYALDCRHVPGENGRVIFELYPGGVQSGDVEPVPLGNPFMPRQPSGQPMEDLQRQVAARLLSMLGGTGEMRVDENGAVCILVSIPLDAECTKVAAAPEDAPLAVPPPHREGNGRLAPEPQATVLVIDDDPGARELLGRYLIREGYSVEYAGNGESGLERARTSTPDVIILDLLMPGVDGWSVLRELGNDPALSNVPVIVSTMLDEQELGQALGAARYLRKPLDSGMVVEAVRESLHVSRAAMADKI